MPNDLREAALRIIADWIATTECEVCCNTVWRDELDAKQFDPSNKETWFASLEHGKGCYVVNEDGGGCSTFDVPPEIVLASHYLQSPEPADEGELITWMWLQQVGFRSFGANYVTKPATPMNDNCETFTMYVSEGYGDPPGWMISLDQQNRMKPDEDHVLLTHKEYRTRGEFREICKALGVCLSGEG